MRVVLQRVTHATVSVDAEVIASIGAGLLLFVGIASGDDEAIARRLAQKCAEMRIFGDDQGRFEKTVLDINGAALVVSQFTLLADVRKGRRPSFTNAAPPAMAEPLVEAFAAALSESGVRVARGRFGAHMVVDLTNDGPVTILLDSEDLERPRR